MHILTLIGIVLGVGVIVTDRFVHKVPNGLAIALYVAATALIIAGFVVSRSAGL